MGFDAVDDSVLATVQLAHSNIYLCSKQFLQFYSLKNCNQKLIAITQVKHQSSAKFSAAKSQIS